MGEDLYGITGRANYIGAGNSQRVRLTDQQSVAVAQYEPAYKELSRAGRRFILSPLTLTGQAPVQAWPTTTAAFYLYNPESSIYYVVDYLSFLCLAGTPGAGCTMLGLLSKLNGAAAQGADTVIVPANIAAHYHTNARCAQAYALAALDAGGVSSWTGWAALVSQNLPAAAFVGGADASDAFKEGRLIIPPGFGLGMTFLSAAGTSPKFVPHIEWSEIQIDSE